MLYGKSTDNNASQLNIPDSTDLVKRSLTAYFQAHWQSVQVIMDVLVISPGK